MLIIAVYFQRFIRNETIRSKATSVSPCFSVGFGRHVLFLSVTGEYLQANLIPVYLI